MHVRTTMYFVLDTQTMCLIDYSVVREKIAFSCMCSTCTKNEPIENITHCVCVCARIYMLNMEHASSEGQACKTHTHAQKGIPNKSDTR